MHLQHLEFAESVVNDECGGAQWLHADVEYDVRTVDDGGSKIVLC